MVSIELQFSVKNHLLKTPSSIGRESIDSKIAAKTFGLPLVLYTTPPFG